MEKKTHALAREGLLGTPLRIITGETSEVALTATEEMAVDERGLIHGGFTFGLADYAAMLAVNHPFVVLGGSECRFLAPVKVGDSMIASASVEETKGRRRSVSVDVNVGDVKVFTSVFACFVLEAHILD
ncbi:MAG: MaoC/PaaZ C-terminal domain-containing protein [Candidatus Bathyarchaeota archaeon]|nr:MaoC/PaaZ C-terminal domain-containing protein [Candidatus Bathyarchaeota archaeon]